MDLNGVYQTATDLLRRLRQVGGPEQERLAVRIEEELAALFPCAPGSIEDVGALIVSPGAPYNGPLVALVAKAQDVVARS